MTDYITFVEEQIAYFKKHSKLAEADEVTPYVVNSTLAHYTQVGVALAGEYTRNTNSLYYLHRDYKKWWNQKFYSIRENMIKEYTGKTIKLAVKEIENALETECEQEYWNWQDKIHEIEQRISFLKQLMEQWSKLDNILNNLSKNMRQEMISLHIEERMNRKSVPDFTGREVRALKRQPVQ